METLSQEIGKQDFQKPMEEDFGCTRIASDTNTAAFTDSNSCTALEKGCRGARTAGLARLPAPRTRPAPLTTVTFLVGLFVTKNLVSSEKEKPGC